MVVKVGSEVVVVVVVGAGWSSSTNWIARGLRGGWWGGGGGGGGDIGECGGEGFGMVAPLRMWVCGSVYVSAFECATRARL